MIENKTLKETGVVGAQTKDDPFIELAELQLAVLGGGSGSVVWQ